MKTLVTICLYQFATEANATRGYASLDVYRMWLRHLRTLGQYQGDVLVFTNLDLPADDGVRTEAFAADPKNHREVCFCRVLERDRYPYQQYDVILSMDVDILTVAPLAPMFPSDDRFWVSPSNLRILDKQHAWHYLTPLQKLRYRFSPAWSELGVSSCLLCARTESWEGHMKVLGQRIQDERAKHRPGMLHDQAHLNSLYLRDRNRFAVYPRSWIQHHSYSRDEECILWHFPGLPRRSEVMREFSRRLGVRM